MEMEMERGWAEFVGETVERKLKLLAETRETAETTETQIGKETMVVERGERVVRQDGTLAWERVGLCVGGEGMDGSKGASTEEEKGGVPVFEMDELGVLAEAGKEIAAIYDAEGIPERFFTGARVYDLLSHVWEATKPCSPCTDHACLIHVGLVVATVLVERSAVCVATAGGLSRVPNMLKDVLLSPVWDDGSLNAHIATPHPTRLARARVRGLMALQGSNTGFNLRNLVWHGFVGPGAVSRAGLALCLAAAAELLGVLEALDPDYPRSLFAGSEGVVAGWKSSIPAIVGAVYPWEGGRGEGWVERVVAAEAGDGRGDLVSFLWEWGRSGGRRSGVVMAVLFPLMEHALRRATTLALMDMGKEGKEGMEGVERLVMASQDEYYTTLDTFLDALIALPSSEEGNRLAPSRNLERKEGEGYVRNPLWWGDGEGGGARSVGLGNLLYDVVKCRGGLRLRDRISHGEVLPWMVEGVEGVEGMEEVLWRMYGACLGVEGSLEGGYGGSIMDPRSRARQVVGVLGEVVDKMWDQVEVMLVHCRDRGGGEGDLMGVFVDEVKECLDGWWGCGGGGQGGGGGGEERCALVEDRRVWTLFGGNERIARGVVEMVSAFVDTCGHIVGNVMEVEEGRSMPKRKSKAFLRLVTTSIHPVRRLSTTLLSAITQEQSVFGVEGVESGGMTFKKRLKVQRQMEIGLVKMTRAAEGREVAVVTKLATSLHAKVV